MEPDKTSAPSPLDQIKRNIEAYERVYGLCLQAASRIAKLHDLNDIAEIKVAKTLFDRFYDDQNEAFRGERTNKGIVDMVRQIIERRGVAV